MASFWLSKQMLLEALKLSESMPQTTMIMFEGSSEVNNGVEQTIMKISTCGRKKTIKEDFKKLSLANSCNESLFNCDFEQ